MPQKHLTMLPLISVLCVDSMACVAASLVVNFMNAYPLSLNTLISCIVPKGENVLVIRSSVMPFVKPPQYTVQLVGLLWLYTY